MLRNLSVARRERTRPAPPSSGGGTAPFARSRANAPGIAVSPVGRNRTRLPTILVVCLVGQPPAQNWALRCFDGLPPSNE